MLATFTTLQDGTVTIVLHADEGTETELLKVFVAQTYGRQEPARVMRLGPATVQLLANDKIA